MQTKASLILNVTGEHVSVVLTFRWKTETSRYIKQSTLQQQFDQSRDYSKPVYVPLPRLNSSPVVISVLDLQEPVALLATKSFFTTPWHVV